MIVVYGTTSSRLVNTYKVGLDYTFVIKRILCQLQYGWTCFKLFLHCFTCLLKELLPRCLKCVGNQCFSGFTMRKISNDSHFNQKAV